MSVKILAFIKLQLMIFGYTVARHLKDISLVERINQEKKLDKQFRKAYPEFQ